MPWEVRWFDSNMGEFSIEKRIDQYVFLPHSVEVGIKIRGGSENEIKQKTTKRLPRMELKWRRRRHPNFYLLDHKFAGVAEEWIKWSWRVEEVDSTDPAVNFFARIPRGPIIEFEKNDG